MGCGSKESRDIFQIPDLVEVQTQAAEGMLAVEFDDNEVRVRVIERLEPNWNQSFEWANIRRVCFKDGGMLSSDVIYISLKQSDTVKAVLTEAKGGPEFVGALVARGLFPDHVWRKALGDTSGGMHCWPPEDRDS